MTPPTGIPVPIGNRVVALWSIDPAADNRSFLRALDPEYFLVTAHALAKLDGGREEQHAATHIRTMRDQAAEMLFALIAAAIQSPGGAALWMQLYRNDELDEILDRVDASSPIRTAGGRRSFKWLDVARLVTQCFASEEHGAVDRYRERHAQFWSRLSREFRNPLVRREYASLKHGLRVSPGGCEITVRPEISPGVIDPSATPTVLRGSGFGSSFWTAERVGSTKHHFRLVHRHRHWTPESLLLQLDLTVNSIKNVIQHLLLLNGGPRPFTWTRPTDDEAFAECWGNSGSLLDSSFGVNIEQHEILALTEDEMMARCDAQPQCEPPAEDGLIRD